MQLSEMADISRSLAETGSSREKRDRLADFLRRLSPSEAEIATAFLTGQLRQGRIGIGAAAVRDVTSVASASAPTLSLHNIDAVFQRITQTRGKGSNARRLQELQTLFAQATSEEQRFLQRLLLGELRQGALQGVMVEAVARAAEVPAAKVRRAWMLAGDLREVAKVALVEGTEGLARFDVQLFRPVQPMLAMPADDVQAVLDKLNDAAFEYKLDGVRVQVHKAGGDVRIFTRQLHDVTRAVPEIVQAVQQLPARELILDGEALSLRTDGRPHPFQTTMRRFGRSRDIEQLRESLPLTPFFFDCLYVDGRSLIDETAQQRCLALGESLPGTLQMPRLVTRDPAEAEAFMQRALDQGHEGLLAKSLSAGYQAGRRGQSWLKIKPAHTLDLVVLAAEWGSGRRHGTLSNLHLGARDPETGGFAMIGKTFKGLTDEMLQWQTQRLLQLETARESYVVHVRPELVVEVAFSDVQTSPRYASGVALRFARVKRYRADKSPADADTIATVRAIHAANT
jgi:DNA ligase-1